MEGSDRQAWIYGEENERGERLLNFCLNNGFEIVNTVFYQRKAKRKLTWESPDGKTKNMIDFIIVNNRWKSTVTKCRTFTRPDVESVGSDGALVESIAFNRRVVGSTPALAVT